MPAAASLAFLPPGSPPKTADRPHGDVEGTVRLAAQLDRVVEHRKHLGADRDCFRHRGRMAQPAGFAFRIVIAENLIQLLDAGKRGVQAPPGSRLIGRVGDDLERRAHPRTGFPVALQMLIGRRASRRGGDEKRGGENKGSKQVASHKVERGSQKPNRTTVARIR